MLVVPVPLKTGNTLTYHTPFSLSSYSVFLSCFFANVSKIIFIFRKNKFRGRLIHMILQKVALNTGWQIIGKAISIVTGIAVITLLTRSLGATGYGGFTTVTSFLQFFGIIVDFGLTLIAVQMLSTDRWNEKRLFDNFMSLKVVTSFFIFGLAVLIAWLPTTHISLKSP